MANKVDDLLQQIDEARKKLDSAKDKLASYTSQTAESVLSEAISLATTGIPSLIEGSTARPWGVMDMTGSFVEGKLHELTGTQNENDSRLPHAWGSDYNADFKDQWIRDHERLIRETAQRHNLPPELLSGILWLEAGGKADFLDHGMYALRKLPFAEESGLPWIKNPEENTSFGQGQMQIRRAAEELYRELGYDSPEDVPEELSKDQEREIIQKLEDPAWSIELTARHLDTLREDDAEHFGGNTSSNMTDEQLAVIATRYNLGPEEGETPEEDIPIEDVRQAIEEDPGSHGQRFLDLRDHTSSLLK